MRKSCACLLILLLLFSCALAEELPSSIDPAPLAEEETSARAYADRMEERFGVTILVGDECLNKLHASAFTIGSRVSSSSLFLQMTGYDDTISRLMTLESALEQYPPETFQYIKDEQAPEGIRFLLADRLIETDPEMHSAGYAMPEGSYYNIILLRSELVPLTVHHEMWHVMEMAISTKHQDAFLIWDALNPEGFQYSYDYSGNTNDYNPDYFARAYGTVSPLEDRATIAEAVFSENRNEWFAAHPAIKRKLDAMNLALKDPMVIQYNVKIPQEQ